MKATSREIQTERKIQVNLMSYKLLGKHRTLMKGGFEFFERLAYQTRKSDRNSEESVVSSLSFLPLTKKRRRKKIIS